MSEMPGSATGARPPLAGLRKPSFGVGVVALAVLGLSALVDVDQMFRAWLIGFVYWLWIGLGALGILSLQYLTGGVWGVLMRRPLEAASRTMPLLALFFVPVLFGLHSIYEWTHEEVVVADEILRHKMAYLNQPFFIARTVFFFACWILLASFMNRWSRKFEASDSPWYALKLRRVSAAGLLVVAMTGTFASIDWMMSLEPHWYSTMYGLSFVVGCLLSALAFATLVVVHLSGTAPLAEIVEPIHFRDFGNLQLTFVMLWAYTAFSQFLLIWYANIEEEVPWYLRREQGVWGAVAVLLIVFHFFLPFVLLLMRGVKDRPRTLARVAWLILLMRAVDLVWLVAPAFPANDHLIWMSALAILGLGGIWFGVFIGFLGERPLLPMNEPFVREALGEEAISHG